MSDSCCDGSRFMCGYCRTGLAVRCLLFCRSGSSASARGVGGEHGQGNPARRVWDRSNLSDLMRKSGPIWIGSQVRIRWNFSCYVDRSTKDLELQRNRGRPVDIPFPDTNIGPTRVAFDGRPAKRSLTIWLDGSENQLCCIERLLDVRSCTIPR
jgi:hypothetical protein